jgi:Domain of unknown function (DUF4868)
MSKPTDPVQLFAKLLSLDYESADIQLCLASVFEEQETPNFQKVQLSPDVASEFRIIVMRQVRLLQTRQERHGLRLLQYDPSAMNREYEVEFLALVKESDIAAQIADLKAIATLPLFEADEQFVSQLHFYVIVASVSNETALFFRFYSPQNELSRSSFLGFRLSDTVFNKIDEPTFLFNLRVDAIAFRGVLYILNKNNFQRIFRYYERMRAAGKEALDTIAERITIENFDAFSALCQGQLNMMAKLKNIAAKEYLQRVTIEDIKRVIRHFRLDAKITKYNGEERLLFDPNSKDKWLILRILDDDYLGSMMTKLKYEANSKRQLPE